MLLLVSCGPPTSTRLLPTSHISKLSSSLCPDVSSPTTFALAQETSQGSSRSGWTFTLKDALHSVGSVECPSIKRCR